MKSNKSFTPSWVTLSSSWNINKETLRGKYSIYIKINDKIYKTNNYIEI